MLCAESATFSSMLISSAGVPTRRLMLWRTIAVVLDEDSLNFVPRGPEL